MDTTYDSVSKYLLKNNLQFHTLNCGPAGKLLVVPGIARILGLWTDPSEASHLWINSETLPNLTVPKNSWLNSGGHRIWIAPERQFFIRDLSNPLGTYLVPAAIDPGSWQIQCLPESVIMSIKTTVDTYGLNKQVPLTIVRKTEPINEISFRLPSPEVAWAGYREAVSLETNMEIKIGLWSLLQVPLGGTVTIPSAGSYKVFFGDEGKQVQSSSDFLRIRYENDYKVDFKIGLKASTIKGNILWYEFPGVRRIRFLAVKFEKEGNLAYVDHPWSTPNDTGYLIQFFCGGHSGFGELEIHGTCGLEKATYRSQLNISVLAFECPLLHADQMKQLLMESKLI